MNITCCKQIFTVGVKWPVVVLFPHNWTTSTFECPGGDLHSLARFCPTTSACPERWELRKVWSSFRYVVMNSGNSLLQTTSRNMSAAVWSVCLALKKSDDWSVPGRMTSLHICVWSGIFILGLGFLVQTVSAIPATQRHHAVPSVQDRDHLEHPLSKNPETLGDGCFWWRHNQVLRAEPQRVDGGINVRKPNTCGRERRRGWQTGREPLEVQGGHSAKSPPCWGLTGEAKRKEIRASGPWGGPRRTEPRSCRWDTPQGSDQAWSGHHWRCIPVDPQGCLSPGTTQKSGWCLIICNMWRPEPFQGLSLRLDGAQLWVWTRLLCSSPVGPGNPPGWTHLSPFTAGTGSSTP